MDRSFRYQRYGTIKSIARQKALILLDSQEKREKCQGCSLCATSISPITMTIKVPPSPLLSVGDRVAIGTIQLNEVEAALLAFMLPLLMTFLTYILCTFVFGFSGNSFVTVGSSLSIGVISLIGITLLDSLLLKIIPPEIMVIRNENTSSTIRSCRS